MIFLVLNYVRPVLPKATCTIRDKLKDKQFEKYELEFINKFFIMLSEMTTKLLNKSEE